jgi:GTP-binding protein
MFYDEVKVYLKAGDGGDGIVSFRREKYIPKGGPNGGDGGKGGDVIIEGDRNTGDLRTYHYNPQWKAKNGGTGMGRDKHGKNGESITLKVPLGTIVIDLESGQQMEEILKHGQTVKFLEGGRGGLGNVHFKSSTNRVPRQCTPGKPGEEGDFKFLLKTIADIGLVGFPNAGKSSLTRHFTNAQPKVAAYPFTTLNPSVGIIDYEDTYSTILLADIPGLIEGASENKGLGHKFLRHIERCKRFLLILDMAGVDERDPVDDYKKLLAELKNYDPAFLDRPRIIAANKMDLPNAEKNITRLKKATKDKILPLSCETGEGLDRLKAALA